MDTKPSRKASRPESPTRKTVPVTPPQSSVPAAKRYAYWIGLTPDCPFDNVRVGGECFCQRTGEERAAFGEQKRLVEKPGSIVYLTAEKLRLLAAAMPRQIVRYIARDEVVTEEDGTKRTIRRARIEKIMAHEVAAERARRGYTVDHYIPKEGDEPLVRYAFAVLCEDQENPTYGRFVPPTLEEVGLELPDDVTIETT